MAASAQRSATGRKLRISSSNREIRSRTETCVQACRCAWRSRTAASMASREVEVRFGAVMGGILSYKQRHHFELFHVHQPLVRELERGDHLQRQEAHGHEGIAQAGAQAV